MIWTNVPMGKEVNWDSWYQFEPTERFTSSRRRENVELSIVGIGRRNLNDSLRCAMRS